MDFSIQLSADYPDKSYGGDKVYADMLNQAVLADRLGFESVTVTEHHLMNLLMMPAPLQFAVKIAERTKNLNIIIAVVVLPLHDMRILAGELVATDIFTDSRLMVGVGRGAFRYEIERLGVKMEDTREIFDESLDVLKALLSEEEVGWKGKYYNFDPLTIMPRPVRPGGPPIMMAVLNPEGIYHCTKRGFHIQTTPLAGDQKHLASQVNAFKRGKEELGDEGRDLTLTLSRLTFVTTSEADRQSKIDAAYHYYSRFDNVFTGPGIVEHGVARPLPRAKDQTRDVLADNIIVGSSQEVIDKLGHYAEMGADRFILNFTFETDPQETLDSIQRFGEEVMPVFKDKKKKYGMAAE